MEESAGTGVECPTGAPEIDARQGAEPGERETEKLTAEETREKVVASGRELFKKLVEEFPPDNQERANCLVNAALFLCCIIQNSLYNLEDRESFIRAFCETMRKNSNWLIAPIPKDFQEPLSITPAEATP